MTGTVGHLITVPPYSGMRPLDSVAIRRAREFLVTMESEYLLKMSVF